ncbi:type I secretion system permease/ATPase [Actibacterium sp. 188UL27-1]|uniref:type I secretion system permease/ATPase n=1 Tax=Actibacterium sp. 188UL27-1 TaxID=2786961 RepID=UPI00195A5592|nr:ATP-binding cassette domain-containing protein [Actibacterium sp. 188UL27-1]MBM7070289.1 ATP-binding cassette domain-containing protein [Actibacterium sp. 188UL27-1]
MAQFNSNHVVMRDRRSARQLLFYVCFFSVFRNLLVLTGPLFMLLVYDQVLMSQSSSTLVALTLIMTFLFLMMGVIDHVRGRLLHRVSQRVVARNQNQILRAGVLQRVEGHIDLKANPVKILDQIGHVVASPGFLALFDLPFVPLFILALAFFHPYLALLAIVGALICLGLSLLGQPMTRRQRKALETKQRKGFALLDSVWDCADKVRGMGLNGPLVKHLENCRVDMMHTEAIIADRQGGIMVTIKTFRMFLQSAILALGALFVLTGEISAGAMIAGSILMGRVLGPIDVLTGHWTALRTAIRNWRVMQHLSSCDEGHQENAHREDVKGPLLVQGVVAHPPATLLPVLAQMTLKVPEGRALGVIGPAGAGKTVLAQVLSGAWHPTSGDVLLGQYKLHQLTEAARRNLVGYLSEDAPLFPGTIGDNIAGFVDGAKTGEIIDATIMAGIYADIAKLKDGFNSVIGAEGPYLTPGQKHRIALSRAFFAMPELVILDEPDQFAQPQQIAVLREAINRLREFGRRVVVITNRSEVLSNCDMIVMMEGGQIRDLGPANQMISKYGGVPIESQPKEAAE